MPAAPWFAVYDAATGALVSEGSVVADPLPEGLAVAVCDPPDPDAPRVWDAGAHAFVPAPAPRRGLTKSKWQKRFTEAEVTAFECACEGFSSTTGAALPYQARAGALRIRAALRDAADGGIYPGDDPRVTTMLRGMVAVGILTPARLAAIDVPYGAFPDED